jgi:mono/diheme cytochrome c family protein
MKYESGDAAAVSASYSQCLTSEQSGPLEVKSYETLSDKLSLNPLVADGIKRKEGSPRTAMPAFKGLKEKQVWQLIHYIRKLGK